jgi:hypothetical protein
MKRRERLLATLRGDAVDRSAVSFYEINGLDEDPANNDPYNIYTHPSWHSLLELAREKTDRMVMRGIYSSSIIGNPLERLFKTNSVVSNGSCYTTRYLLTPNRTLTTRTRRDPDVNTIWTEEHLFKTVDDINAFLALSLPDSSGDLDIQPVLEAETALEDTGIVMIDTPDPLCLAASLFNMAEYTVIAMTEKPLFQQLLERFAFVLIPAVKAVSVALPGRLWRIYGPEYASPPYLPPSLFRDYVCRYVKPMIETIQQSGGYARVHCHGNLRLILDDIAAMGPDGLDPIEPPPQGDVELSYVRERCGKEVVLFGNLEMSDIENMPTARFEENIKRAIEQGTAGEGRGFVLMPSACPYGRRLSTRVIKNYEKMIEIIETL